MGQMIINAIVATLLPLIIGFLVSMNKKRKEAQKKQEIEAEAFRKAMQAVLRNDLIGMYSQWYEHKGYAPIYIKDTFENSYQQYHTLYQNGVMGDIYDKFMSLKTEPTNEE